MTLTPRGIIPWGQARNLDETPYISSKTRVGLINFGWPTVGHSPRTLAGIHPIRVGRRWPACQAICGSVDEASIPEGLTRLPWSVLVKEFHLAGFRRVR
jgi:hypothetical protein